MRENDMFGKKITINTEVTNGECPTCKHETVFVSLYKNVYRCVSCGTDNEQKVNGVISYMPIKTSGQKLYNMSVVENNEDGT